MPSLFRANPLNAKSVKIFPVVGIPVALFPIRSDTPNRGRLGESRTDLPIAAPFAVPITPGGMSNSNEDTQQQHAQNDSLETGHDKTSFLYWMLLSLHALNLSGARHKNKRHA
jgi:hypothetical protein